MAMPLCIHIGREFFTLINHQNITPQGGRSLYKGIREERTQVRESGFVQGPPVSAKRGFTGQIAPSFEYIIRMLGRKESLQEAPGPPWLLYEVKEWSWRPEP